MSRSMSHACFVAAPLLLAMVGTAAAGAQTVNGCEIETATSWFDSPAQSITFSSCCSYSPPCVKINAGDSIIFSGSFFSHPLNPGFTERGPPVADPGSPIVATITGSQVSFTFVEAGVDPFYCGFHYEAGMFGTVFVAIFADGFENVEGVCDWSSVIPPVCP